MGGSYTNEMKFNITEAKIIFHQENIALEALDRETVYIPFTVLGLDPDKMEVDVDMEGESSYKAEKTNNRQGVKTNFYNLVIAVVTAVIIVLAMNLVGSLLISALIIFPALSAMRIFKSFKSVTICAAILSVCCTAIGILGSMVAGTPVGPTIVVADILAFIVFFIVGFVLSHVKKGA